MALTGATSCHKHGTWSLSCSVLLRYGWWWHWAYDCWWSQFLRGQLIGLSLLAASFFLESHRGANQEKCWSRLCSCTLDLALVIGHALFDWDKVITCYLFRNCPLLSAVCTPFLHYVDSFYRFCWNCYIWNINALVILKWIPVCLCRWWKQIIFLSLRALASSKGSEVHFLSCCMNFKPQSLIQQLDELLRSETDW